MPITNLHVVKEARLVKDPVAKDVGGKTLVEVTIAENPWGDKDKERYSPLFITATFSGNAGQTALGLRKGDSVAFEGPMFFRQYVRKDGKPGGEFEIKFPTGLVKLNRHAAPAADDGPAFDPTPPAPGGFDVV